MHFKPAAGKVSRKRWLSLAAFVAALLAAVSLTTGVTMAQLGTNTPSQSSSFSSATVTLTDTAIASCPLSNLLPSGDFSTACTFSATYSGSAPAYLAVDVLVESQAGSGGSKLYNPSDTSSLHVSITSTTPSVTYSDPATVTACPGSAPINSTCFELDDELIDTSPFNAGSTVNFGISVMLPTSSTTGYQGGAAQVTLTTHAVQAGNNTISCALSPAAGSPCTPTGSFKWN